MKQSVVHYAFILLICHAALGEMRDPFPMGYSMINFGTIIWDNGVGGRQPWTPSCFYNDTLRFGVSAAAAYYYDPMDNLKETSINQMIFGGWSHFPWLTVKTSFAHFSALDLYFEQTGYLSLGTDALKFARISFELYAFHAGIREEPDSETMLFAGESFWVPWKFVSLSFTRKHIRLKGASSAGIDPPTTYQIGIHTKFQRYGAQGILVEFTDEKDDRFRIYFGEEYRFHESFALGLGIATSPFMISVGATVNIFTANAFASFVNHPVLGWSKGFGMEWSR
ncbi:MAG: hypothetical protein GF401_00725 [Chitinivibrionales bacterium]|nr:hypothetical protein [Chitinivibrionales bacterium]